MYSHNWIYCVSHQRTFQGIDSLITSWRAI